MGEARNIAWSQPPTRCKANPYRSVQILLFIRGCAINTKDESVLTAAVITKGTLNMERLVSWQQRLINRPTCGVAEWNPDDIGGRARSTSGVKFHT
jgi:hypothetical protein